jgi:hypothetical protein
MENMKLYISPTPFLSPLQKTGEVNFGGLIILSLSCESRIAIMRFHDP